MRAALAVVVATATLLTGCGAATPDYQSLLATTPTRPTPTTSEETIPLSAYLESVGVKGEPVAPEKLTDLAVTVPRPKGWQDYTNTNLAPGTRVIADGETYPTAMLMVFTLDGDFDTAEALKHADVDAEVSENFKKLNGSREDFKGFPSSMIEGTYDVGGQRMQAYNRIVFATGKMPDKPAPGQLEPKAQKYLVQLTITSFADDAEAKGAAIEQIISGFNVAAK
ncbi:MAG: LpqN/LpqT family lipoprotein [Mycobacterium sp.]|nr:LpqN/LpqT family lipoprotein [Mycobacterium sp.]